MCGPGRDSATTWKSVSSGSSSYTNELGQPCSSTSGSASGEMRRHFRDKAWTLRVPRALKDLQGPVREGAGRLARAPVAERPV